MRHYEAMYLVDAETPDEELEPIIEKYKKVIVDGGGEVSEHAVRSRRACAGCDSRAGRPRAGVHDLDKVAATVRAPRNLRRGSRDDP